MTDFYTGWMNYGSSGKWRLILSIDDPPTVHAGISSYVVGTRLYLQTDGSLSDNVNSNRIYGDLGDSGAASVNVSHGSGGGTTLLRTQNGTVYPSHSGDATFTVWGVITGFEALSTQTISGQMTVPRRPWYPPMNPVMGLLSRIADNVHTFSWTNTVDSDTPYESIDVYRYSRENPSGALIYTVGGSVTSFTDYSTNGDSWYAYLVQGKNSAGAANSGVSNVLQTTPGYPVGISAYKNAANNIVVAWEDGSYLTDISWTIEESQNSGASWTALTSGIAKGTRTYTHTSPSTSVLHRYRVKAVSATPVLSSAWSTMATDVQLAAPPAAPTGLGPSTIRDATDPFTLSWTHNPVDSSPQSGFQLRHRNLAAGGAWTTVTVTSSVSSWTLPANSYANPITVEWQVATKGQDPSYGPWSASATAPTSTRPTAAISSPTAAYTSATVVASWTYYDAESTPQIAWEASLYNAAGTTLVEQKTGSGADSTTTFSTKVGDGTSWQFKVRVRDTSGMWSNLASISFSVSYALPTKPSVAAPTWSPDTATISLTITNPNPVGAEVAPHHNEVYRRIDGGGWVPVAGSVPLNTTVVDYAPTVNGLNEYRVDAVSALASLRSSDAVACTTPQSGDPAPSVWLSGGTGFSEVCRAAANVSITAAAGLANRVLRQYAGRLHPVEHAGVQVDNRWSISTDFIPEGSGVPSSPVEDWLALAVLPGPFLLRRPDGSYRYVSVSGMSASRAVGGSITGINFTATEVDRV